jgi:hypoxanthine phosphoribosyltransferase
MTMAMAQECESVRNNSDLIYSAEQIKCAINRLAVELEARLAGRAAHVLCVMNGALIFTSDLVRHIDGDLKIDYLQVSSYGDTTTGGEIEWHKTPQYPLQDQVIVIVDDIFDRGSTMHALISHCQSQGADEIITCVMLSKNLPNRSHNFKPDLIGLEVDDRYVFGYGMDYKGHLRHMPDIYALKET